jgi:16S rRNA (guanine527-N7)-methyltransferase
MTDSPLAREAAAQGITLTDPQVALLQQYCEMLWDWNTRINLTRHTDYQKFVARDLMDSLAFAEFLQPKERVLDVGTGGGVPGVILSVMRPDLEITLSESIGKKARVVAEIVQRMGIGAKVYHGRAQELLPAERFDTLAIRAVAKLAKLLEWFQPLWHRFDRLLILKGPSWVDERGEARHLGRLRGLSLRKLKTYTMPGTEAESVLLQVRKGTEEDADS